MLTAEGLRGRGARLTMPCWKGGLGDPGEGHLRRKEQHEHECGGGSQGQGRGLEAGLG